MNRSDLEDGLKFLTETLESICNLTDTYDQQMSSKAFNSNCNFPAYNWLSDGPLLVTFKG